MKKFISSSFIFIIALFFIFSKDIENERQKNNTFEAYTGRINATNVRMRTGPDIQELLV